MDISDQNRAAEDIERHVAERTNQLTRANEELRKEIAERKLAEEALREQERFIHNLTELSPIVLDVFDLVTECHSYFSGNAVSLFGYTPDEMAQMKDQFAVLVHPDDIRCLGENIQRLKRLEDGEINEFECRVQRHDGEWRWIGARSMVFARDERGEVRQTVNAAFDITDRKRAGEALQRSREELEQRISERTEQLTALNEDLVKEITERKRAEAHLAYQASVLANIHDVVFATDEQLTLTAWNRAAEQTYGWKAEEVLGRKVQDVVRSDLSTAQRSEALKILDETGHYHNHIEVVHYRRDGKQVWIEGDAMALRDEAGQITDYVTACRDITGRKRAEEALQKAQAELAHVTRVTTMGELAASIAHEINQPLGAIVNNGNVCLRLLAPGSEAQNEVAQVLSEIVNDAERASAIIARIRALTKPTALEKIQLQLKELVGDVLALAQRELAARRITGRTELPEDLPSVTGDRIQLQQVLLNLVMNSINAMSEVEDQRGLLIIGGRRYELEGQPAVLVSVHDLGCGFSPEDADRLFEAFYTTKPQGMGMGLRISRSVVEAHGGHLWAQATEEAGATFFLALPAEQSGAS